MVDDKAKTGTQDRSRVSSEEPYEVAYFAAKHGITQTEAREVLSRTGASREAANAEAKRIGSNNKE